MPHLQQIFDSIAEGLLAVAHDGTVRYANPAAAELFGCDADALTGRRVQEFADTDGTRDIAAVIEQCLADDRPADAEVLAPLTGRWHAIRCHPGDTGVTVFLQDVTDRRLAEQSLRLSEAKFAGIVGISADAIISIGADHRIIHFNSGAEEIFGWSAAEMIGETLDRLIPERFRATHPAQIRGFASSGVEARRMGERREISGVRKSGEEFPAEASISQLKVGEQRIFTVVLRDVTERRRQEETYRQLWEEAQRAVAARDDVLSFVSHDLGNPLAAIRIATAVLLRRIDPASDDGRHIRGIREAVEQAQRLIRDLLDVQKAEAGRLVLHTTALDIRRIIAEGIDSLHPLADEKAVAIEWSPPQQLRRVHADPDRTAQIFGNILGNAIKFSPQGGTVRITAQEEDGAVVISVGDEGPGIPAAELPHIFDRWWQAKETGKVGHGVGLSIVQALTRAQGGRVWAESNPGAGAVFSFALPSVG